MSGGAIFRGTLTLIVSTASSDDRAGAVATFFAVGYTAIWLPVVGAGVALQYVSFKVTIFAFAVAIVAGILVASPLLLSHAVSISQARCRHPAGETKGFLQGRVLV